MKREIIQIDEQLCNGCGLCIPACPEGALQIIDGKARLVSDLMCDGLGACVGECPESAITIEEREAEPYNERAVIREMVRKGENTVAAHLKHLLSHNEAGYFEEAMEYLDSVAETLPFDVNRIAKVVYEEDLNRSDCLSGACHGANAIAFRIDQSQLDNISVDELEAEEIPSALRQWPVQLHLVNPRAPYFQQADVLLAADCVAFALGNFHRKYLTGHALAIACPKLDQGKEVYLEKLKTMIDEANIRSLTIMVMEVPCCSGLVHIAQLAHEAAARDVPIRRIIVGIKGNILQETTFN